MNLDPRLIELLERAEELREQGHAVDPAELCADCPELLEELKRHVRVLQGVDRLLEDPTQPTASGDTSVTSHLRSASAGSSVPSGFQLVSEIGQGGMGRVYRARDLALDREVAVKVLLGTFAPNSVAAGRFLDEARITGQLQHPGIPAVYQVGALQDGRPFLAMKLIKGQTLDALLKAGAAVDTLSVFAAITQAVGYAHAHGVIHRDLKPQNVMVGAFGEVQVMDWGLAKVLTASRERERPESNAESTTAATQIRTERDSDTPFTQYGRMIGTPAYMAPEQAAGELDKVGPRADVFGLGAILCSMLTGKPPYGGKDVEEVRIAAMRGQTAAALARLDGCAADPEVIALCKRCLAFDPAERLASAGALAAEVAALRQAADKRARQAELERVRAEGEQAKAEAEAREQRKRRRVQLGLVAAVLVCGLVSVAAAWLVANERQARRLDAVRIVSESAVRAELACEQARSFNPQIGLQGIREFVFAWERANEVVQQADATLSHSPVADDAKLTARVALLKREVGERLATARDELNRIQKKENLLRTADQLAAEDQAARAAELAREAVNLDSKSPWSYLDLGDLLAGLGNYEEARSAYKKAEYPDEYGTTIQKGVRLRLERLDLYAKFEPAFLAYVREGAVPEVIKDRLLLAEVCFLRGYYVRAAKLYQAYQGESRTFAVRAFVFAGCGLGKDRGELDESARKEMRAEAWKLSQMAKYEYSDEQPIQARMSAGETAGQSHLIWP